MVEKKKTDDDHEPIGHRPFAATTLSDEDYEAEQELLRTGVSKPGSIDDFCWTNDPLGKPRKMPE